MDINLVIDLVLVNIIRCVILIRLKTGFDFIKYININDINE